MYKKIKRTSGSIRKNSSREGETIEKTLQRALNNNEAQLTSKEIIYTRPEDGVVYGTDIRGDKWARAIEVTDKVSTHIRNKNKEKYESAREEMKVITNEISEENKGEGGVQAK